MKKMTQFSTMNALLVGLYDGFFSVEELKKAGNLGLGCTCGLAGELILTADDCYTATANQKLKIMQNTDLVPFAQVAQFEPTEQLSLQHLKNKDELTAFLLEQANTKNLFIGFKVEGAFKHIKLRQPPTGLKKPYPPMTEVFKNQTEETLDDVKGTLIGFWSPEQYQGVAVAGLHVHFIDDAQQDGGHVLDLELEQGICEIQCYADIEMKLPTQKEFLQANLEYENLDADIKQAEN
ncbi:acetolactate decarboxylase [Acinetobacter sp. HY1485]|uniref:acetolactate decarboxylase n=1 Tax=Acinetobacter sp. HY1485 TaxID=2970918 RepID=UPI0022B97774|nr:acetolactate decarboxylase [Acinetobacter sp. HY1485]